MSETVANLSGGVFVLLTLIFAYLVTRRGRGPGAPWGGNPW